MYKIPTRETQAGQVVAADPNYADHFAKTANYTLLRADSGNLFSNKGAAGSVNFTLPAAQVGLWYTFVKAVKNQNLVVTASGGATINGGAANGNMTDSTAESIVATLCVICYDGVNWTSLGTTGTWATS